MLEIRHAVRRALPLQLAFFAPTGAGKTFSALKFAAGLCPNGKIAVIDTELGRASLYADNKKILADLPNGFDVVELEPPYSPERYIEAIDLVEKAGYGVCIIDSGSDSWDGPGGCADMAEKLKGMWATPKLWNKRMMMRAARSDMHIIWCLKAQDKTKIIGKEKAASGKQEYVELGMRPIWEKSNLFPMLLVFSVDPETHLAKVTKCHDDLWNIFPTPKLITANDGERVRLWNESGKALDPNEQLQKRARAAAEEGLTAYEAFFKALPPAARKTLTATTHAANKEAARQAHRDAREAGEGPQELTEAQLMKITEGKRDANVIALKQELSALAIKSGKPGQWIDDQLKDATLSDNEAETLVNSIAALKRNAPSGGIPEESCTCKLGSQMICPRHGIMTEKEKELATLGVGPGDAA